MKKTKVTVIFLLSSLIISCGFHLRGNQDLSLVLPQVQLQGVSKQSVLGQELHAALTAAKVNVDDESENILMITKHQHAKRVLSLDSAGHANQYELSYQLNFSLVKKVENKDAKSKLRLVDIIPSQNILEKREYFFDANLLLAKADEEIRLNNDMRQSAILQMIRRLLFSLKSKNKSDKD